MTRKKTNKYFVYGALMHNKIIRRKGKAAYLPGYMIQFSIKGIPLIEPGFATLVPAPGDQAWGVMVELNERDWVKMSSHEVSYQLDTTLAYDLDYQAHEVKALLPKPKAHQPRTWKPSSRYARMLYYASCHFHFPEDVKARYREAYLKGNKVTRYIPWFTPTIKKSIARFGKRYGTWIGITLTLVPFAFLILGILYLTIKDLH
ncbi:MAG: gamma-glutamylcyclotransferase [Gammaproteobacteria bacterium]|nr:MAG: gamma-glutamylcyclotransferase [Gammaproteobacteria bacterium]